MTDKETCYACEAPIEEDEWVIPLKTHKATYFGGELTLDADSTVETVIHADCLKEL